MCTAIIPSNATHHKLLLTKAELRTMACSWVRYYLVAGCRMSLGVERSIERMCLERYGLYVLQTFRKAWQTNGSLMINIWYRNNKRMRLHIVALKAICLIVRIIPPWNRTASLPAISTAPSLENRMKSQCHLLVFAQALAARTL